MKPTNQQVHIILLRRGMGRSAPGGRQGPRRQEAEAEREEAQAVNNPFAALAALKTGEVK